MGLKPTWGRASKAGVLPMSWQFDHPGPIVKCVEDAAIVLQAIAGYDVDDFATVPVPVPDYREGLERGVRGLRIGVPREQFFGLLDAEVRVAIEGVIETLRGLGAEIVDDFDPGFTRSASRRVPVSRPWWSTNRSTQRSQNTVRYRSASASTPTASSVYPFGGRNSFGRGDPARSIARRPCSISQSTSSGVSSSSSRWS